MAIATPTVHLIAHTVIADAMADAFPDIDPQDGDCDADFLAEVAGRSCYESYGRPNPKTATNAGYLDHIIELAHNSVLEHATATFRITGASRALLAELTRHRHLSYSVVSQRYVDVEDADYAVPPAIQGDEVAEEILMDAMDFARECYGRLVERLVDERGLKRKAAREAARAVMPNMTETKIVVTGNMSAWRYVIARRIDPSADAEIREVAGMILAELKKVAPNSFGDFE